MHRSIRKAGLAFRSLVSWRTGLALAALVCLGLWIRLGPLPAGLLDAADEPSTVVLDRHGERLYEARTGRGTRGTLLAADGLPPLLAQATVAAEDVRFRSHWGVDARAIARAAWRNLRARRIVEGGSTISQQVVELLTARERGGRAPRGWRAKAAEAVFAIRLEHRLTKDEILALYLNLAPYGNQVEGAARAAEAYFGRDTRSLTAAEAAFLAALPQQPSRYNPWRDPAAARGRQLRILASMARLGAIDGPTAAEARSERLAFDRRQAPFVAPHFVERVMADVGAGAGAAPAPRRIDTTLDASLQRAVQGIISARRRELTEHDAFNVAVAVLDNRTGEWLAWEGSGDYGDTKHGGTIDGIISPRQPGSALKPFTYAAAFERGSHPASVLADVPSQFPTAEPGILYSPRNYDDRFRGPLRTRLALAGSENVPAVAVASELGVPAVARMLRQVGLTTLDNNAAHYGLGLTLGNAEVRLDELVAAYATIARGGLRVTPRRVTAIDGAPIAWTVEAERVMAERTAFFVTDILSDAEARAYVFGRGGSLEFPFPVAAKTGTSQAYHDNWAIGFTRDVTVGVWVGNFDRTPLRTSSGVTGAGPIFHDVMMAAVERIRGALPIGDRTAIIGPPADVDEVEVCALSGLAPGSACPTRIREWVPQGASLTQCTWHHHADEGTITVWPDEYRHWARAEGLLTPPSGAWARGFETPASAETEVVAARARDTGRETQPAGVGLRIVAPLAGALYLVDPSLRREFQALPLRATGAAAGPLEWFVNGASVGRFHADEPARWPMVRGEHAIMVKDTAGRTADTRIVVR